MKIKAFVLAAALAATLPGPALAAEDPDRFLLTPALVKRYQAVGPELKKLTDKLQQDDDDDDDDDGSADEPEKEQTVEQTIKDIQQVPGAVMLLAKQGLTVREFVLASYAMLQAGMYVAMEGAMDKQKAAQFYAGLTKEQKANIALMRTMKVTN